MKQLQLLFLPLLLTVLSTAGLTTPSLAAVLDPGDYLALQAIRSSLSDLPGSTFFSTWDFTSDPCSSFSGLLCSAGRVISLSLGDPSAGSPGLSGRLPSSLSSLSALSHLSLVPGRVSGPIPASFSPPNLRFLALSHNFLSGRIPPSLSSLRYLHTLDLGFNFLSGPIPHNLHLPSLATLILSRNRLSAQIPDLSASQSLIHLDLKRNFFSGSVPSLPSSLRYVSMSSNQLSGRIEDRVARLTKLEFLDLSMNKLSGPIPSTIFSFQNLAEIRLQRNMLDGQVKVMGMTAAITVDLSYNRLGGPVPEGLASAERIYLNFNRFEGRVPGKYGERMRSGGIKVLYMQRNYLVGIDGVGAVPESVSLCLNYNCMTPPNGNVCPVRSGRWKRRPEKECKGWTRKGVLI